MTTHACPGGCGASVPRHLYACKPCWFRLPRNLRDDINVTYRTRDFPAHRAAMAAAAQWYTDQANGGAS